MEKRIHEVVHTLREKPVHVRENIAFGVAGGVTFIVAVLWFVANSASGTFSLKTPSIPDASAAGQAVAQGKDGFDQLLGAAGSALGASSSPAQVEVVDTEVRSTLDNGAGDQNATDQTIIHF